MKNIILLFSSISLTCMIVLSAIPAFSQPFCGATDNDPSVIVSNDPHPLGPDTLFINPAQALAQTFIANQVNSTGAAVVAPTGNGSDFFVLSLVEGSPDAPGAVLAMAPTNAVPVDGGLASATWPAIVENIVIGNTYHILVEAGGPMFFSLSVQTNRTPAPGFDEYPGGMLWFGPAFFPFPGFDLYFQIEYCTDIIIPTMGQWGLILFALLLLSFGTVQVLRRQAVLSGSTGIKNSNMPVPVFGPIPLVKKQFVKALWLAGFVYIFIFGMAITGFGYEWMKADFTGILFTLPVLAYLIHLFLVQKET